MRHRRLGPRRLVCHIILFAIFLSLVNPAFGAENERPQQKEIRQMTLADAIFLAIRNNLDLQSSFLDRVVQKFSLRVAEERFKPQFSLRASTNIDSRAVDSERTRSEAHQGSFNASLFLPTGGSFNFLWDNGASRPDIDQAHAFTSSWSLSFLQPLLKGAGKEVVTATLKIAQMNETQNILSLKNTLMSTITVTIQAFRSYLQALRQLEISKASLEMGKSLYETNKALIAAGRLADMEIVQAEADIANRELSLISSQSNVESARLTLIRILNIDRETAFAPLEAMEITVAPPELKEAHDLAFAHRPDYQQSLYDFEAARLNLLVAENNRRWDLSLQGGIGRNGSNSSFGSALGKLDDANRFNWNAGTVLTIPFGLTMPFRDLTLEQQYVSAKVSLEKAKLNISRLKLNIEIEIRNGVRDVELKLRQVTLARQARVLAEKKWEIENEKLRVGRTTNFQLISFQNDRVSAQNQELNAAIDYLNALAALDQTLGTTLMTWKIDVGEEDKARGVLPQGDAAGPMQVEKR